MKMDSAVHRHRDIAFILISTIPTVADANVLSHFNAVYNRVLLQAFIYALTAYNCTLHNAPVHERDEQSHHLRRHLEAGTRGRPM